MKTIYFGQISPEVLESYGPDSSFDTAEGEHYEFKLEINEEGIKITDAIGRYVPMQHRDADALFKVLRAFRKAIKCMADSQDIQDFVDEDELYAFPNE